MGSANEFNLANIPLLEEDTEMEVSSGQVAFEVYNNEVELSLMPLQVQKETLTQACCSNIANFQLYSDILNLALKSNASYNLSCHIIITLRFCYLYRKRPAYQHMNTSQAQVRN